MWVSMVLTSQAHRRRTPKKNRRIPTILTGRFGGWIVHVSAVDTGPCGSESAGFLVAQPGAVAVWNHRHSCLRPCVICRTQPPPPGGPSPFVGRAADRPRPAPPPGSHHASPTSWPQTSSSIWRPREGPQVMVQRRLRPESARVGLLHEGRDLLATGCVYCTKAPPTRSTPNSRPVAPHRRAVHPDDAGQSPQSPGQPPPTGPSSSSPLRQTRPTGVLRGHDIRNSQKS